MAAIKQGDSLAVSGPSNFGALDELPLHWQGDHVILMFRDAKTINDYTAASKRWAEVRPKFRAYERDVKCDASGAASDKQIAWDIIDDLHKAPMQVVMSVVALVLAFAGREKDEFFKALEDAYEEAKSYGLDALTGKLEDKAKEGMQKAYETLREALLQYLQSVSRKHFKELLDGIWGTVKAIGKTISKPTMIVANIILTPTEMTPEWCIYLDLIDEEQRKALERLSTKPMETVAPRLDSPSPSLVRP
jgi:hypothetical protein